MNTEKIIEQFNDWAQNPANPLPDGFTYMATEPRIQTHQPIMMSNEPKKWIVDTGKNFLFPNPNFFDQMTDISDLYKYEPGDLMGKGNNAIAITRPAKMEPNSGFINFPGEFDTFRPRRNVVAAAKQLNSAKEKLQPTPQSATILHADIDRQIAELNDVIANANHTIAAASSLRDALIQERNFRAQSMTARSARNT